MKRTIAGFAALVVGTPILLAMGVLGEPQALNKAPEPKTKMDAVIVDMDGVRTEISYVSYDGELYLPLYKGKAIVTIPFKKISRVDFGKKVQNNRQATIDFVNGRKETFLIDEKTLFVGKLPIGTYQIQAKDVESITFVQPPPEPAGTGKPPKEKQPTQ